MTVDCHASLKRIQANHALKSRRVTSRPRAIVAPIVGRFYKKMGGG